MSANTAIDRRSAAAIALLTLLLGSAAPACAATIVQADAQSPPAAAPAPAPSGEQPKTGPKVPENVEPLSPNDAASVLGKKVKGPDGEDLGLIVDILVNSEGKPRAAVIDFGGFLGVGSRKIAIDWKALDFTSLSRSDTVELGLQRAQIAAAPEYKPDPAGAVVVTAPPAPAPPVDVHK